MIIFQTGSGMCCSKELSAKVKTYKNAFNVQPELEDAGTPLASGYAFVDKTQFVDLEHSPTVLSALKRFPDLTITPYINIEPLRC